MPAPTLKIVRPMPCRGCHISGSDAHHSHDAGNPFAAPGTDWGTGPRRLVTGKTRTILVADSDLVRRSLVVRTLGAEGYGVVLASSGIEALELIRRGGIDLLVSAVVMSGMDGLELLRTLRDSAIKLPAIAVSSGNDAIDDIYLKMATLLGAARVARRPLRDGGFLGDVRTLLEASAG